MVTAYRRWACGLLAGVLVLLIAAGAVVWAADPCFTCVCRRAERRWPSMSATRTPGLPARPRRIPWCWARPWWPTTGPARLRRSLGGSAVRLTVPDGYLSEFDTTLEAVFAAHPPERVIFGLDANILVRDESGLTGALPEYLYNANPLDDVRYFLNRDTLYYSVYTLLTLGQGGGTPIDELFTWDEDIWWNHMTALG